MLTPNPIAGSTRKITGLASGNTVKGSQVGIAFYKEISNCYCFIEGNILEGYSNGAIVPMTLPAPYSTWTRVAGSSDYGTISSGTYTGKPFPNVMIGLNFAI